MGISNSISFRRISFLLFIGTLYLTFSTVAGQRQQQSNQNGINNNNNNKKQSNTKVISLAESITRSAKLYQDPERVKASREQWKKALEEIKDLTLPRGNDKRVKEVSLMQWKMLLDEPIKVQLDIDTNMTTVVNQIMGASTDDAAKKPTPRFEGFASWERMLQDWADDVQEYMDKIDAENAGGYPMSSWGSPGKTKKTSKDEAARGTASETLPHF